MKLQARFTWAGTNKGTGRWRNYYDAEDLDEARRRAGDLVPRAQVRVMDGRTCIAGPMLAEELAAERSR